MAGGFRFSTTRFVLLLLAVGRTLSEAEFEGACAAGDESCSAGAIAATADDLSWQPRTISVVLPCAGEERFALKTIVSVAESVPGGSGGPILTEIIVVDDGSEPPLSKIITEKRRTKYNVRLVRHETTIGLMGAKSAGAAVAKGDIIVFFDCHVAPQEDWYDKFLKASAVNYRRIVVPVITNLDIDTWTESNRGSGMAKCYLTWDADFKWITSDQPYMPVLSGGLLGISRRWWNETGGYDSGMTGWGGENIDQSLRTWLCGGEIYSMADAFVAHMWRVQSDPRTLAKYAVSSHQSVINRARAIVAWYGDFDVKAQDYPQMKYLGFGPPDRKPAYDVSELLEVRDRLKCRPLSWFLWRFRDIYVDGGLLPEKTFKLQETTTKLCLAYQGPPGTHPMGKDVARLGGCDDEGKLAHADGLRWHLGNQIPRSGKCCSGLRTWNTDQCLNGLETGATDRISMNVCDVSGKQGQTWQFITAKHRTLLPGQLQFRSSSCLLVDTQRQFMMAPCKRKDEQLEGTWNAPWKRFDPRTPIETELYNKAQSEHPELFK